MANISAIAKTPHTVTALEAAQGFCVVHVSWPSSFFDTNSVAGSNPAEPAIQVV